MVYWKCAIFDVLFEKNKYTLFFKNLKKYSKIYHFFKSKINFLFDWNIFFNAPKK